MTSDRLEPPSITRFALAIHIGLSLVFFAPAFLPDRQIAGTDYFTGGYYFLEFAMRRLGEGSLPKWVPYVFGGLPMYSNPGGLFYPVRLLFSALLPVARVMPALYVVQFAAAGIGMHLLARALGARQWVALLAGVAFQMTGVTMSYLYAGHDGRIIAATLAPFVFLCILKGVKTGELRWYIGLAASLAFILLSFQLQSAYYLLLAAGAWTLQWLWSLRREMARSQLARRAVFALVAVGAAFGVSAVNFLPFSQYVEHSPRSEQANRGYAFSTQFSMPVSETIGLAVPEHAGILNEYRGANPFKLHTEYVGAVVIAMLIVGAVIANLDHTWRFMAGLSALMLSICYGSNTRIYELYYRYLPGTPKFRSPSIALYLVSFGFVVMGALALEQLARLIDAAAGKGRNRYPLSRTLTGLSIAASAALIVALGTALDGSSRALGWARFLVFFVAVLIVTRAWTRGRLSARTASIALIALTVVDLWIIDRRFFWTQPPPDIAFAEDDVVNFLKTQPPGRVWVFPFPEEANAARYLGNGTFGLHTDYLMHFGIPQAGGEHGNQLFRWNQLVGIAPSGNTLDWHNFVQYPAILDAAGVRYIVSGVRLELYDVEKKTGMPGIREAFRGSAFVYANDKAIPRVALVPRVRTVASPAEALRVMQTNDWTPHALALVEAKDAPFDSPVSGDSAVSAGEARVTSDDPDRIAVAVQAAAPAMLVLSDNHFDGWTASVDGRQVPILRTNSTFRGVPVTQGRHEVVFEFQPRLLYAGLWVSLAFVILLCGAGVYAMRPLRLSS